MEVLDKYFGSVCELDIIFNFEKAYFILDELVMAGEVQETSKKAVLKQIEFADNYQVRGKVAADSCNFLNSTLSFMQLMLQNEIVFACGVLLLWLLLLLLVLFLVLFFL